jgi:plasmid maintenance system antidote protein VapI
MNTFTKQELKKILEAINFINDGDTITCDVSMKLAKMLGHNS